MRKSIFTLGIFAMILVLAPALRAKAQHDSLPQGQYALATYGNGARIVVIQHVKRIGPTSFEKFADELPGGSQFIIFDSSSNDKEPMVILTQDVSESKNRRYWYAVADMSKRDLATRYGHLQKLEKISNDSVKIVCERVTLLMLRDVNKGVSVWRKADDMLPIMVLQKE